MKLDFYVYVCVGRYDGGDVCIRQEVSDEEIKLLKRCYRRDIPVEECEGLEDLSEILHEEAISENASILDEIDQEEELPEEEWDTTIYIPEAIKDMVNQEDENMPDILLGLYSQDCDEGTFGSTTTYSIIMGEKCEDIMTLIPDYTEYVENAVDEEEYREFKKIVDKIKPNIMSLEKFNFDNGYFSTSLEVFEGMEVVDELLELARRFEPEEYDEDEQDKEEIERQIITEVEANPSNMDAIRSLYQLVCSRIESHNESMW